MTSSTAAGVGSIVISTSAPRTAADAVAARRAWRSSAGAARPGSRSNTVRSKPASASLRLMGPPMCPSPMNASFIAASSIARGRTGSRGRRAPPARPRRAARRPARCAARRAWPRGCCANTASSSSAPGSPTRPRSSTRSPHVGPGIAPRHGLRHAGGDARLRGAPREVPVAAGLDGRLVDEQRHAAARPAPAAPPPRTARDRRAAWPARSPTPCPRARPARPARCSRAPRRRRRRRTPPRSASRSCLGICPLSPAPATGCGRQRARMVRLVAVGVCVAGGARDAPRRATRQRRRSSSSTSVVSRSSAARSASRTPAP